MIICHDGGKKKLNNSFIPAWILSGAVSAATSGRVGASARSAENHTAPKLSDKKKHKKIDSVWLKGGWKRLDLAWRREKMHLGARRAHSRVCGCSFTHDVILSIVNDSLCGWTLIASQEFIPPLLLRPMLCWSNFAPPAISQEKLRFTRGAKSTTSWVGAATLSLSPFFNRIDTLQKGRQSSSLATPLT